MKVLVATKETQGQRGNDFCHANEGEIVNFHLECDGETVDGECGCRRSMSGIETHKATTTIKVAEIDITREKFFEKIKQGLQKGGWLALMKENEANKFVKQDADELLKMADHFDVNSVIEKRGDIFRQR